jgi:periplasmic divalent cation tolerance protein
MKALVALTTVPNRQTARRLATSIVRNKLAACVSIQSGLISVYRWKNKIETSKEALLLIKTSRSQFNKLAIFIRKNHPYKVPEVIALPVRAGTEDYLKWLNASLR